jgi:hypothetical protein
MRREVIPRRRRAARESPQSPMETYVPGQMPTYKDHLRQQHRAALERVNISRSYFPDDDVGWPDLPIVCFRQHNN